MNNKLYEIIQGAKNAVMNYNTSFVLIIDGKSGYGKTTFANQVGITFDKGYDLKKLHYSPKTFLEGGKDKIGLSNAKPGDVIVFDEAMLLSARGALTQMNRLIIQAMSIIRSRKLFVIFCINAIFDLDKNIALSRANMLLHVFGENETSRGRFVAFFKSKGGGDRLKTLYLLGKKSYLYSRPKGNFTGKFVKEFIVNQQAYDEQKDKGVTEFLENSEAKTTTRANIQRDLLICHLREKFGVKTKQVSEVTDLSVPQINKILALGTDATQKLLKTRA